MFHFLKKDREKEVGLVERIINNSDNGTLFVFCIQNMKQKVATLKSILNNFSLKEVTHQEIMYSFTGGATTDYLILAVRKL